MKIEVRLFATLARYLPTGSTAGSAHLDVADGSSVSDVAEMLGVPSHLSRVVLVNDRDVEESARLGDGDVVTLFPPLAGGGCPGVIHSDAAPSWSGGSEASRNPVGLPDFKSGVRL